MFDKLVDCEYEKCEYYVWCILYVFTVLSAGFECNFTDVTALELRQLTYVNLLHMDSAGREGSTAIRETRASSKLAFLV